MHHKLVSCKKIRVLIRNLPSTPYLASFNAQLLLISIPVDRTIYLICNARFEIRAFPHMSTAEFKRTLSHSSKEEYFIFIDLLYQQVDEVSIGSLLRPTLANIVLSVNEKILNKCSEQFKPLYYNVGDTLSQ